MDNDALSIDNFVWDLTRSNKRRNNQLHVSKQSKHSSLLEVGTDRKYHIFGIVICFVFQKYLTFRFVLFREMRISSYVDLKKFMDIYEYLRIFYLFCLIQVNLQNIIQF